MANQKQKIMFRNTKTGQFTMPVVTVGPAGTEARVITSFNSFPTKDAAKKYMAAQRLLASMFLVEKKFESIAAEHELVKTVSYESSVGRV